jgi:Transglycosylase SLT domain/SPOR domain
MSRRALILLMVLSIYAGAAYGQPAGDPAPPEAAERKTRTDVRDSICLMIEAAARSNDLPLEYFARVIWQESRFRSNVTGPRTRSGERAQGIAQFMPRTAAERGLLDPFDPVQALPKAAEFLRDLRRQFGNLGLAAAAYNAGPQRVRDWMGGRRTLPEETRNYVLAVTGIAAADWVGSAEREPERAAADCPTVMALLQRTPNPFVERLEQRVTLAAGKPWGVQLSAGFARERALTAYSTLAQRFAQVLSGQEPVLLSTTLRSRGTRPFYQVRVGAETRAAADNLCNGIRRAGGACMVLKNRAS